MFGYVEEGKIATAKDKALRLTGSKNFKRQWENFLRPLVGKDKAKNVHKKANGKAVEAEINCGRWIARCKCGGAEVVDPDEPIFMCLSCGNKKNKGLLLPVTFPDKDARKMIENCLAVREIENCNWKFGEQVADLRKENLSRGLEATKPGTEVNDGL